MLQIKFRHKYTLTLPDTHTHTHTHTHTFIEEREDRQRIHGKMGEVGVRRKVGRNQQ